jgi:hypothetical protein
LVEFGVAEERFGRDATPVEAGATGAFHFDAGHFFAELSGADRADISGGSSADHDEIVCHKNVKNACFWDGDSRRNGGKGNRRGFKIGNLRFQKIPIGAAVWISDWRFELPNR